ncbi:hypothetical protein, partial [Aeromonas veronii]|uniref:hypothetical protein n=1 Tax=Aeromonas veronii TaxID=654 RepID=UPI0011C070DF
MIRFAAFRRAGVSGWRPGCRQARCLRGTLPVLVDPARGTPAGPVPAARARAADRLGAQGGHCWSWWIRLA